eukprot:gnl/TRDRNA2_/TRDRNA2_42654_c0_seq1.p1 gnl/TRDRNA2_/TRDRNA2_42654_c0~~gnl/TRDRNA2_/TRDRNA2_42654_c0_seq1.p1  ORF type:complete len:334 (-),score=54.13 gnl/TRDRNA2_/TRDRNA2_42654_c0_seq1:442-1320(-)
MQAQAKEMVENHLDGKGMNLPVESAGDFVDRASESLDNMIDNLLDRALKSSPLRHAHLDRTMLEKSESLERNRHISESTIAAISAAPRAAAFTDSLSYEHAFAQKASPVVESTMSFLQEQGLDFLMLGKPDHLQRKRHVGEKPVRQTGHDGTMLGQPFHLSVAQGVSRAASRIALRLSANDTQTRRVALATLDELGTYAMAPHADALADLVFDEDVDIRNSAMNALRRMNSQADEERRQADEQRRRSQNMSLASMLDKVVNSTTAAEAVASCRSVMPHLKAMCTEAWNAIQE